MLFARSTKTQTPRARDAAACAAAVVAIWAAPIWAAHADDAATTTAAAAASPGDPNRDVYDQAFFKRFNPITALDMARQVPGFTLDVGDDRRGFSANAGNVLINGERPSSKEPLDAQLRRIPASGVERMELVRGGDGALDVRGRSSLLNIVLAANSGPSTTYVVEGALNNKGRLQHYAQITRKDRIAGADVTLDLQLPSGQFRADQTETLLDPAGAIIETRDEAWQEHYRDITLAGAIAFKPSGRDTLNANAKIYPWLFDFRETSEVFDADGDPSRTTFLHESDRDALYFEAGGDWERKLGAAASVKLVGLLNHQIWDYALEFETFGPEGFRERFTQQAPNTRGERILRASTNFGRGDAHAIEVALEGAFNFLDTDLTIFVDDGSGPIELDLPVAAARVEELRFEPSIADVWRISPKWTLDAGLAVEASRITQTGDADQEREFTYPKPRATLTRTFERGDQLRFSIERDVAQLDFREFASSVAVVDGNVNLGNPDLEPERSWKSRLEWERKLGERSAFTLALYHDQVEAVQDLVPLPGGFEGLGNLGDGARTGLSLNATAALDRFGLPGAVLKVESFGQTTRVDDPFTGETRRFQDEADWRTYFEFRQDFPERAFAYGWDYNHRGSVRLFRSAETFSFPNDPGDFDVFVETTRLPGMTIQFAVDNVFDPTNVRDRYFFTPDRASGALTAREERERRFGRYYRITVRGAF